MDNYKVSISLLNKGMDTIDTREVECQAKQDTFAGSAAIVKLTREDPQWLETGAYKQVGQVLKQVDGEWISTKGISDVQHDSPPKKRDRSAKPSKGNRSPKS